MKKSSNNTSVRKGEVNKFLGTNILILALMFKGISKKLSGISYH